MLKQEKISIFRDRFRGRSDVYGRQFFREINGVRKKQYAPVCSNFWSDGCHIKNKTSVPCSSCEIKKWEPVSDDTVWKHISGDEPQIQYLVQDDSTVWFAAIDFDNKPNSPQFAYYFEDVKAVAAKLFELGIPCGVARSSGEGFHIYIFFEDPCPASHVIAFYRWLFEATGFAAQAREALRPVPEFFPKQISASPTGPGNGICCAMIETEFARERKGFVDGENKFIPANEQWQYLAGIQKVSAKRIADLIAEHDIKVRDEKAIGEAGATVRSNLSRHYSAKSGKWEQPLRGSIEKVVEGCKAFRGVMEKSRAGQVIGHTEGFALFHLAMHCADGIDYFKKNVTGWGQNEKDIRQLEHSVGKDYAPWTCAKLQESGICVAGTKCFEKRAPVELVEGQIVPISGIPPEQWPEPSPIRYAHSKGEDFLEKLKREVSDLEGETDVEKKGAKLREVSARAQVFDQEQQRVLKEFIKSNKIIKTNELNKMFNKAEEEKTKKAKEDAATRSDMLAVNDSLYQALEYGYALQKKTKNGTTFARICSCTIEILEECRYLDEDDVIRTSYNGKLEAPGYSTPFEINAVDWHDTQKFVSYFGAISSGLFNVLRADVDNVRQAAMAFSTKKAFKKASILVNQGWYKGTYLMPTVLVDADGVRPNTDKRIDISGAPPICYLDFKILEDDQLREVLFHIKNDLLNAWPRKWTTIALSHALLPALVKPLKIKAKASLFLEGLTGSGKTELLTMMQWFWGEFESLVNLASTGKGLMAVVHEFKDALVVFDDFKSIDYAQVAALQRVIQYSYDNNTAQKLNKDSTLMKPKFARGVIAFTGEHFLTNDAAQIARTILIEVDKQDTTKTRVKHAACLKNRHLYSGVTPRFISWCLNKDLKEVMIDIERTKNMFQKAHAGRQNVDRIAMNMSVNHVIWKLFADFLEANGACAITERDELVAEHYQNCIELGSDMLNRCAEEQNGEVFLRYFEQGVASGEIVIIGINDGKEHNKNTKPIGQKSVLENGTHVVNVLSDSLFRTIKQMTFHNTIRGTEREFGRQFIEKGLLLPDKEGKFKRQIRIDQSRAQGWVFDVSKLEFLHNGELYAIKGGASNTETVPMPKDMTGTFSDGMV